MTDITMCQNSNCPGKLKCYRYTATPSYRQSYMSFRFRYEATSWICNDFIENTKKQADMAKAKYCDECKFFHYPLTPFGDVDIDQMPVCTKGHKPRFFKPRRIYGDGGFKRKCEDFEIGDHVKIINV